MPEEPFSPRLRTNQKARSLTVHLYPKKLQFTLQVPKVATGDLRGWGLPEVDFAQEFDVRQARKLSMELYGVMEQYAAQSDYEREADEREADEREAIKRLQEIGDDLYCAIIPEKLAKELQKNQTNAHLELHLPSDLLWIPWELLWDRKQFLCERFCLARQLRREGGEEHEAVKWQVKEKRSGKVLIVLGDTENMKFAATEGGQVKGKLNQHYEDVTKEANISRKSLMRHLKDDYDIVHFIGHGKYKKDEPSETGWLCSGEGLLSCKDIKRVVSRAVFPLLIYANACVSARPTFSTSENYVANLHEAFLRKGVLQYIGTVAHINDKASSTFAVTFYEELAGGATIGEALRQARLGLIGSKSPIWAYYYVHYGDPAARLPGIAATTRPSVMVPADPRAAEVTDLVSQRMREYASRVFVGREEALASLDSFVTERPSGTLIVSSDAGFGKTALLAGYVANRQRDDSFVAYHFFRYRHSILNRVAHAYRHLAFGL